METALRLVLTNAAAAAVIATVALVASRLVRRPAVAHALWLMALVKLVTPPLVPLPLLPSWDRLPTLAAPASPMVVRIAPHAPPLLRSPTAETVRRPAGAGATDAARPFPAGPGTATAITAARAEQALEPLAPRLRLLAAMVIGAGALSVMGLAAWRFVRFRRLLAWAEPAPAATSSRAAQLAAELGLRRVPPVLVVPARIPPMLWPEPGGPRLLLPRDLLPELRAPERDALLAHELAHVHRRDHWVRLVELVATALFWWYPLTWWARAALRRAEERCCDEWVLRVLPRSAEAYANALLKSLTFVSTAPAAVPALASGASPLYELELRLKEILMSRPAPRLAPLFRLALVAAAVTSLAVFPIHALDDEPRRRGSRRRPRHAAGRAPRPRPPRCPRARRRPRASPAPARVAQAATPATTPAPAQAPATPRAARSADADRAALDAQRRELDAKRRSLQRQELELQHLELELNAKAEQAELRAAAEEMRAQGNARQAELYEAQLAMTGRRTQLERRRLELDSERLAIETKLEAQERAQRDKLAALEAAGSEDARRAAELDMERAEAERHEARGGARPQAQRHGGGGRGSREGGAEARHRGADPRRERGHRRDGAVARRADRDAQGGDSRKPARGPTSSARSSVSRPRSQP